MITLGKTKSITGLDLEAGSIAATEVRENGSVEVTGTAVASLGAGIFREGEVADHEGLVESLKQLFAEHKLAKTVRVGIANQRVVVRTLRLPAIEERSELETAIRFQAQDQIPMPLDEAVLDYQVVGRTNGDGGQRQMDVIVVAARRQMISALVSALRKAGLRPTGVDLSAFAMIRALAREQGAVEPPAMLSYEERMAIGSETEDAHVPATLYCNLGDLTNLAVARGSTCLFTRVSPFGVEGIAQRLAERRGLTLEHARQWLLHVGLDRPVEEIDGDPEIVAAARSTLDEGVSKLVDELRLSLEYYGAQEGSIVVEGVVACGPGSMVPDLVGRIERELGTPVSAGTPQALGHLDPAEAARLTLPFGLAVEE